MTVHLSYYMVFLGVLCGSISPLRKPSAYPIKPYVRQAARPGLIEVVRRQAAISRGPFSGAQ